MKKKILSLVLVLAMALSLFPGMSMTASAEGGGKIQLNSYDVEIDLSKLILPGDCTTDNFMHPADAFSMTPDGILNLESDEASLTWIHIHDGRECPVGSCGHPLSDEELIMLFVVTTIHEDYQFTSEEPEVNLIGKAGEVCNVALSNYIDQNGTVMLAVTFGANSTKAEVDALLSGSEGGEPTPPTGNTHSHCVCVGAGCNDHNDATEWTGTATLPTEGNKHYYLTENVELTSEWHPAAGTVLCLNGHSVKLSGNGVIYVDNDFVLTDCNSISATYNFGVDSDGLWKLNEGTETVTGGVITGGTDAPAIGVTSSGSFTMYGGNLVGNAGYKGGGIWGNGERVTIYGGSIRGNTASQSGGGIFASYSTVLELFGGVISDNTAPSGGGVYPGRKCVVGGKPEVRDNWKSGSESVENNVEIITAVWGDLGDYNGIDPVFQISENDALEDDAEIGVTLNPVTSDFFTRGWGVVTQGNKEPTDYFFSDNPAFTIQQALAVSEEEIETSEDPAVAFLELQLALADVTPPEENPDDTPDGEGTGIYPYGQNMTDEELTLHIDVAGTNYQWQVADAADSDSWEPLMVEGVAATDDHVTFTPAETDLWYRCVVDGTPSEAVQAIQVGETVYEFTKAMSGQWYLSNGSMAYFTAQKEDYYYIEDPDTGDEETIDIEVQVFDVVGKYTVPGGDTYWANTSYEGYDLGWQTGAETNPMESYGNYTNDNIEKIKMTFDVENDRSVRVEAKLKAGYNAAAFGTDTMLGDENTSGDYSDSCSLKAIFEGETLKQIQMVAAESLEKADPDNDLAMVITPITPNAIFWIGAYGQYDANEYYGKGEAYGYNKGALYNLEFLSEEEMGEYWEEVFGEPWEDGLTYNDYLNKTYRKEGPGAYANYVTEVQGADSALALSWTDLPDGGTIQFVFSVGTIAETGATVSGLTDPNGSIDVNVAEGATISIKKDGTLLTEDVHYTVEVDGAKQTITFMTSAGITCGSELQLGITVSGSTTWQTIANDIAHAYSWVQGASQHHQKCSKCGDTTTPADHYYVDGRCSCGKTESSGGTTPPVILPPVGGSTGDSNTPEDVTTGSNTETTVPTTETTAKPSISNTGSNPTATVTDKMGTTIVDQAKENNSDTVVIAPEFNGSDDSASVVIPTKTVNELGRETDADLVVETPVATVTFGNNDLTTLGQPGGNVVITTEKVPGGVELDVTVNGQSMPSIPGGVLVNIPEENLTPGTVAMIVHEDGTRELVRKSVADVPDQTMFVPLDGSATVIIVDNAQKFDDVQERNWFSDAVAFASGHELFQGITATEFGPNVSTTRGMLATVIYRMENEPNFTGDDIFGDMSGKYYEEAAAWAASKGIVNGYAPDEFGGDDAITREQLAAMLWRYVGTPMSYHSVSHFNDADAISSYAEIAVAWANEMGIMNGRNGAVLDPKGEATRAEVAQMLMNFMALIAG